jgi:hypothetical protein
VTALLAACTSGEVGDEEIWALPVGTRIQCLLSILGLEGRATLWAQVRCRNEGCGEPIEVDLTPAELVALAADADGASSVRLGDGSLVARLPTGRDQLAWQGREFRDEDDALRSLAADLVETSDGLTMDDALVAAMDEALADLDPLVCFELSVACPYCGEVRSYELDLQDLLLKWFRERQAQLVDDVHALASSYHWSEEEILAVPPARRARYLELVGLGRR